MWGWPDLSGLGFFDWSGLWLPYQAHAFPGGAVAKHSLSAGALPFLPQPVDKLSGFEATLFEEVATDELDEVAAGLDKENMGRLQLSYSSCSSEAQTLQKRRMLWQASETQAPMWLRNLLELHRKMLTAKSFQETSDS